MQVYSEIVTKRAEDDIEKIILYLNHQYGTIIANKYRKLFQKTCQKLSILPSGIAALDENILGYPGIRKIRAKKYLIFYIVNEENHTVYILRVKHVLMDWQKTLFLG